MIPRLSTKYTYLHTPSPPTNVSLIPRAQHTRARAPVRELNPPQGRSLYFTPRETLIFGYLFDLADTDDDGLVGANDGGHALLGRARLPPATLQRLWAEAGGERCVPFLPSRRCCGVCVSC